MNILLCSWHSVSEPGLTNALRRHFENVYVFDCEYTSIDFDTNYIKALSDCFSANPDIDYCISVNFLPIIAKVCHIHHKPYFSWVYDSPSLSLYSNTLSFDTNFVFSIDKAQTERFSHINPGHIFHLPMCASLENCSMLHITEEDHNRFDCDISFVGSLYTEKCDFRYDAISKKISSYLNGYMEGLVRAQLNVYGYNFLIDSLNSSMAEEYFSYTDLSLPPEYEADIKEIVAHFYLGYKCSSLERINAIRAIGEIFPISVYTNSDFSPLNKPTVLPLISNCGTVNYNTELPKVYKCSKINLNITTKTNQTGIPSRVFDIMAAGGFVISNYQSEIPEYFTPGEDIVLYDSIPDLLQKIDYYLNHEEERLTIAKNGYQKVKTHHTFDNRLSLMFGI
ncbi:MAG: glycosyltransferase [Lachnospiraceae bacterium]|nr:glycosyltransferase [Lachnospiraceae bacterium]